ncbi:hypothetical protein, partial [uncultured Thiodictyon sp.]|uniref:hypothetical protein n=1 Tax=uncultured Thiodictyon sp. TaxID=1846217 RepID=UPI0025D2302A
AGLATALLRDLLGIDLYASGFNLLGIAGLTLTYGHRRHRRLLGCQLVWRVGQRHQHGIMGPGGVGSERGAKR